MATMSRVDNNLDLCPIWKISDLLVNIAGMRKVVLAGNGIEVGHLVLAFGKDRQKDIRDQLLQMR